MREKLAIAKDILFLRLAQMLTNEQCKKGVFKVPVHLAMGHEAIAIAVDAVMEKPDRLVLSHRNIHYHLARAKSLRPEIDEYLLKEEGMAQGRMGSMNLINREKGIVYTSSILGNNLSVATGVALGIKVKQNRGVCIVVTGDGAIEEGSFYENIVFQKSNLLCVIVIIENNQWSLATRIEERRCPIDIKALAQSVGAAYEEFSSNDAYEYIERLKKARELSLSEKIPVYIEVKLETLGGWYKKTGQYPKGKFVNYHANTAPTVDILKGPVIKETGADPVYALRRHFNKEELERFAQEILERLKGEMR